MYVLVILVSINRLSFIIYCSGIIVGAFSSLVNISLVRDAYVLMLSEIVNFPS